MLLRHVIHYALHLLAPLAFGRLLWRTRWWQAGIVMVATMALDVDHLFADPIYDPSRCSLGFHPLHTAWAAGVYAGSLLIPRWWVRATGLGCLWHLVTDGVDCWAGGTW